MKEELRVGRRRRQQQGVPLLYSKKNVCLILTGTLWPSAIAWGPALGCHRLSSRLFSNPSPVPQDSGFDSFNHNSLSQSSPLIPLNEDVEGPSTGFFDVDSGLAEISDEENESFAFDRDEVDMLEEREDRLYVDEFGIKRVVEKCILVGVEDVTLKRKKERAMRYRQYDSDDLFDQPELQENFDPGGVYFTLDESMTEMRELIKTAGMELAGEVVQRLHEVNPRTYIGSGKVKEADEVMKETKCSTIVFDAELTPGQQKALENAFNRKLIQDDFLVSEREIKVIDRTALILDIFAQHAKTREGKLQVSLALHEYRKPRLTKMWTHLERQSGAGGVGLRGMGESQLEIDKRLVRDRIITLKQKIDEVQKQRDLHRRGRDRTGLPVLSLVGYTNAGKSSLLNYLTPAGVLAESMLFATLDPTTRKVKLPGQETSPEVLLTDTVGFIQKLPTQLIAAFRATLEEVREADILIHVIDVSNPTWEKQEGAVLSVLTDIGAGDKPIVRVLNKIDLLPPNEAEYLRFRSSKSVRTVAMSALTGDGIESFVTAAEAALAELLVPLEVIIPYSKGDEVNAIHQKGNVEIVDYRDTGTYVRASVPPEIANRLSQYSVSPLPSGEGNAAIAPADDIDWVAIGRGRHRTTD